MTAFARLFNPRGIAIVGARGLPPRDIDALARALVQVAALAWALRDRLQELDVSPLLLRPRGRGVIAADALVMLRRISGNGGT